MNYPTRQQLFAEFQNNPPTSSHDYHTSEEIADVLEVFFTDYGNMTDVISDVEDLYNDMWNECDRKTPIYNDDLLEWLQKNHEAVDDYRRETGGDAPDSIIQLIMAAYCWTLEQEAMDALQTLYTSASASLTIARSGIVKQPTPAAPSLTK